MRIRSWHLAIVAIIILVGLGCGNGSKGQADGAVASAVEEARVMDGGLAPQFTLKTFDGALLSIEDLRGNPVVLNFWASWCYPCRMEAAVLENAYQRFKSSGVKFVGVAISDSEQGARAFVKEFGVTYPNGLDSDNTIATAYQVFVIPQTIILDREGRVRFAFTGAITEESVLLEGIRRVL